MFISIGSGFIEPVNLRSTATYLVVFDPATTTRVAGTTVTVYDVPADFSDTIDPNETVPVVIEKPGQNGILTFAGTAQQRVSLKQETGSTLINQIVGCDVNASMLKPDSTVLAPATCMETNGVYRDRRAPDDGHVHVVDPVTTATGTLPLKLYSFSDVTSSIAFASPLLVALVPGQNARLTFTVAAQQHISLQSSGISGQVFGCDLNISIVNDADESVVVAPTCMEGNGLIGNTTRRDLPDCRRPGELGERHGDADSQRYDQVILMGPTVPTVYGPVQIDWFADIAANTLAASGLAVRVYVGGKLIWTASRISSGAPIGNALPFQDPAETNAAIAVMVGYGFKALFSPALMKKESCGK